MNVQVCRRLLLAGVLLLAGWLPAAEEPTKPALEPEVQAVFLRWLEALGGGRNIAQLRTVDYRCEIDFGFGQPPIPLHVRANTRGAYRYDYELPGFGRLSQVYDGASMAQWNDTLGFGRMTLQDHNQNLAGADFRAPVQALTQLTRGRMRPEETINGRRLQVVEVTDRTGAQGKWYFEPESGLRVRVDTLGTGAGDGMVVESFDFRPVPGSGVKEAHRFVRSAGGRRTTITLSSILYNEENDPALFTLPRSQLEEMRVIEQALAAHRRLAGAEALRRIESRVTEQVVENLTSGSSIPTKIWQKRPNFFLMEQDVPGLGKNLQGFDGKIGWAWNEIEGYRELQGAELGQLIGNSDLDGPHRLSALCPLRRLLEEKPENGRPLIGIAMATLAGPVGNFYFDANAGHLVRLETFMTAGQSGLLKVTAEFSEFRKYDGVTLPARTEINNPAMHIVTVVSSLQHNVPLEEAFFAPRKN